MRYAAKLCITLQTRLFMIDDGEFPGRVHFIAHAVRDIADRLAYVRPQLRGNRVQYENALDRIARAWPDVHGAQDARDEPDAWLFGTWFDCGKFPNQWSIDQLREFVEIAPTVEPEPSVVVRLAEIADTDVLAATNILDRMVRGDKEGWHVFGWRDSAERILKAATQVGGDAQATAERLINHLGRRGFTEFGKLLTPST